MGFDGLAKARSRDKNFSRLGANKVIRVIRVIKVDKVGLIDMENCAAMVISAAWRQFDRPVQGTQFAARSAGYGIIGRLEPR